MLVSWCRRMDFFVSMRLMRVVEFLKKMVCSVVLFVLSMKFYVEVLFCWVRCCDFIMVCVKDVFFSMNVMLRIMYVMMGFFMGFVFDSFWMLCMIDMIELVVKMLNVVMSDYMNVLCL